MAGADRLIGRVVAGRYRIEQKLGTGGMANVYLAQDNRLGRRVAIKVLHPEHAADPTFVERFRREARAAAAQRLGRVRARGEPGDEVVAVQVGDVAADDGNAAFQHVREKGVRGEAFTVGSGENI